MYNLWKISNKLSAFTNRKYNPIFGIRSIVVQTFEKRFCYSDTLDNIYIKYFFNTVTPLPLADKNVLDLIDQSDNLIGE